MYVDVGYGWRHLNASTMALRLFLPPFLPRALCDPCGGGGGQVRLYSIASTRYGDDGDGRTVSLCVRRATVIDPATGKDDPAKEV